MGGAVGHEALFLGSLALGALIPDIDHTGSSISRKKPFIDNTASSVFGHRSFTHSLLFLVLTFFLFRQTSWPKEIKFGILLGMFSHMILDMLAKQGIKFLWSLKIHIGIPCGIRTDGAIEQGFFAVLALLSRLSNLSIHPLENYIGKFRLLPYLLVATFTLYCIPENRAGRT